MTKGIGIDCVQVIKYRLAASIFKQNNVYVAYTPALDVSTYGKTTEEAQKNFEELVQVFLSEFDDERNLGNVLESLGWTKHKSSWSPPVEVKHIQQSFTMPVRA
jgi:predicted RNase H-like HicB family nuclease